MYMNEPGVFSGDYMDNRYVTRETSDSPSSL